MSGAAPSAPLKGTAKKHHADLWRLNLQDERDGLALYEGLAGLEKDPKRAAVYRELAEAERRHATIWEKKLAAAGEALPAPGPSSRVRFILWLAKRLGPQAVLSYVIQGEAADIRKYAGQPEGADLQVEEEAHRDQLEGLRGRTLEPGARILERERWHRGRSGSIRAAVFGMNDGLVSNLALVLGVAAAGAESGTLIITGMAGLLAGAFSMAVGEFVSVASQRDLLRRQVALEGRELQEAPEEESAELVQIYVRKGLSTSEAERLAAEVMKNPETALDTLVREELGLNPEDLGSPVGAAVSSLVTFSVGAALPILPFLLLRGMPAVLVSAGVGGVVLTGVAVALAVLSGTSVVRGVLRMVGLAGVAVAVTVLIGRLLGATVT